MDQGERCIFPWKKNVSPALKDDETIYPNNLVNVNKKTVTPASIPVRGYDKWLLELQLFGWFMK